MKTKLKVGDKVYDSALFGNVEGEVYDIKKSTDYLLVIKFGCIEAPYTIEGRFSTYTQNPTLSMQPYDELSDIVAVWEEGEVWGLFWDNDDDIKRYGKMTKSYDSIYPYRWNDFNNWKNFKETGKLI